MQDVLGWPWTLFGAICCQCLLIISLFFLFVSLVVFLLLLFVSFIIVVDFCPFFVAAIVIHFFAFCEHGLANLWFNILFSYLFFRLFFFWVFHRCSGKRRWSYVWGELTHLFLHNFKVR